MPPAPHSLAHRIHAPRTPPPGAPLPKFAPLPVTQLEDDGTFRGYASIFNRVDLGRDLVLPGAFRRSIRRRGVRGIRMLYQHDPSQVIGTWRTVREDAAGLFVEGHLSPDVVRAREVRSLMRAGALDGLSIGFHTVRATKNAQTGVRSIIEADLWEVSVVTFPMLPDARVAEVKAGALHPTGAGAAGPTMAGALRPTGTGALRPTGADPTSSPRATPRMIEAMLRRDAGLTRREAKRAVAAARDRARDASEPNRNPQTDPLAARIRDAAALFQR